MTTFLTIVVGGKTVINLFTSMIYSLYEKKLLKDIQKSNLPNHIAIIMDGNRRYGDTLGLLGFNGHEIGAVTLENVLDWCWEIGVNIITVYGFSTENFGRNEKEVNTLMNLFEKKFNDFATNKKVHERNVKLNILGDLTEFPERVQTAIKNAEEKTKNYDKFVFNVAIGYGGRQELVKAVLDIVNKVKEGKITEEQINEEIIGHHLYTAGLPDPDLVIRTSGEERLSGFLLWQSAYSELYFCETYWPSFRKIDLLRAIRTFQQRKRRFGQ